MLWFECFSFDINASRILQSFLSTNLIHSLQVINRMPRFHAVNLRLAGSVTSVNNNVGTGDVRGGVTGKQNVCSLELLSLCITSHWDHAVP